MRRLIPLLLLASFLTSCLPALPGASPTPTEAAPAPTSWWNDAVFYEIFVRSFYDSDGNGIGDFNGITEKLDYLNDGDPTTTADLGITGIWLMPIFPSPSYHGYDVTDYYSVNPQYGTMEDFERLLSEAHKRGIRIVIDMVLNHTSDQHPWFKSAKSDINSPYRNWYIWSDTDPNYRGPWNEEVWHPSLTGYYYGIFEAFMPDLNYNNPEVTQEMEKVFTFWLTDIGVDGFRLDAAKHLIEDGTNQQNTEATHKWFAAFRPEYKAANPAAMVIGEISGDTPQILAKYTRGDQLDLVFDFNLAKNFISSANRGQAAYTVDAIGYSLKAMPNAQFSPFLTNHDQDRAMSQLYGDTNKARLAAALLLTSPGVPFLYYGEEIGMTGKKPDQDIRRPMQWSDSANAGFSTNKIVWRPPASNYPEVNVAAQTDDPTSLLSLYRDLIAIHNAHPALRTGDIAFPKVNRSAIYAAVRTAENDAILVLINLGDKPIRDYQLNLKDVTGTTLFPLFGTDEAELPMSATPLAELAPFGIYIFQVK